MRDEKILFERLVCPICRDHYGIDNSLLQEIGVVSGEPGKTVPIGTDKCPKCDWPFEVINVNIEMNDREIRDHGKWIRWTITAISTLLIPIILIIYFLGINYLDILCWYPFIAIPIISLYFFFVAWQHYSNKKSHMDWRRVKKRIKRNIEKTVPEPIMNRPKDIIEADNSSKEEEADRICIKCRKGIPFDAKICPYCRYDYE